MASKVVYSDDAINDLNKIEEYITVSLKNPQAAFRIVDEIIDRIDELSDFPEIGAPLSSRIDIPTDYRYLVCGNYNVFYLVRGDDVVVSRVLNARQDFMKDLFQ